MVEPLRQIMAGGAVKGHQPRLDDPFADLLGVLDRQRACHVSVHDDVRYVKARRFGAANAGSEQHGQNCHVAHTRRLGRGNQPLNRTDVGRDA